MLLTLLLTPNGGDRRARHRLPHAWTLRSGATAEPLDLTGLLYATTKSPTGATPATGISLIRSCSGHWLMSCAFPRNPFSRAQTDPSCFRKKAAFSAVDR